MRAALSRAARGERSRTPKGERTREALLDLAAAEFAARGYHGTSVAGICRRGGMANSGYYRYFADKRQAYDAIAGRAREALGAAVASGRDLDDLCDRVFDCFEHHGREFQVFREAEFLEVEATARSFYDPVIERIRTLLGVEEAAAWALLGALVFVALRFGLWDSRKIPGRVRQAFRAFVRAGLAPGPTDRWRDVALPAAGTDAAAGAGRRRGDDRQDAPGQDSLATGILAASAEAEAGPLRDRADRTRQALVDAARAAFASQGYAASHITGITYKANVALGTFYVYFPGKRDVLARLVDDIRAEIMARTAAAGVEAGDRLERERRSFLVFLDWLGGNGDVYRIVREAEFAEPAIGRGYYERIAAAYEEGLRAAMDRGEVRRLEADVVGWALMGVAHFAGLRWVLCEAGRAAPPGAVAGTLRFLMHGLQEGGQ